VENTALIVAIAGAAVAGIANIIVAGLNRHLERRMEAEKSESNRILEMIKTGNLSDATRNLRFLIETGLILDIERVAKIKDYLAQHPEGAPVLPGTGERYNINPSAGGASVEVLQSSLREYEKYFDSLGFNVPPKKVDIRIEDDINHRPGWYSYYDPSTESIVIDRRVISDVDCPRREYTHFVLMHQRPYESEMASFWEIYLLESDLADYFIASFASRPELFKGVAGVLNLSKGYVRTLENRRMFSTSTDPEAAFREGREMWGGAFWAIRSALGHDDTDKILATAWRRMAEVKLGADTARNFIEAALSGAEDSGRPEARDTIIKVLRNRRFPIPKSA
jgi:hypothetical protein